MFKWLKGAKSRASAQDVRVLQPVPEHSSVMGDSEAPHSGNNRSGQTIFSAEALDPAFRFRSLTLAEPDSAALEGEAGQQPAFKIRLAKSTGFRRDAGSLVGRRYADRGYLIPQATQDPYLFTFLAYDEGQLAGTISVRIDSESRLSADSLYADELEDLRHNECKLCEFTRLAVDVKTASKPVLAGLFHTAYMYAARVRGVDFGVIEVNPRHVPFYRRSLGFEPLGQERTNARVNAPAVLMCISFAMVKEKVKQFGGKPELAATERMLYPHFFSMEEETGIFERLKDLDAAAG
jgi:hypothetical protein